MAQGAVAQNGGDISNTVITTLDTVVGDFPAPAAGERGKTFFGKVKKFIDDFKALKASLVVVGQIINTFDQTAEGTVADGRALKTLKDLIDTNSTSITELIGQVLMASAISNVQVNATDKVPSSALVNIMQQAITQNTNNIATLNGEMDLMSKTDCDNSTVWVGNRDHSFAFICYKESKTMQAIFKDGSKVSFKGE